MRFRRGGKKRKQPKINLKKGNKNVFTQKKGSFKHFGSLPSPQNLLFQVRWSDSPQQLLTPQLSLPASFIFSPILPGDSAKNIFSQTVKRAAEKERLRSQSCQGRLDLTCFCECFQKSFWPDAGFFFLPSRGRTCEKLWHARVYRCVTVLEAFWQH